MNLNCLVGKHQLAYKGMGYEELWTEWECMVCEKEVSLITPFGEFIDTHHESFHKLKVELGFMEKLFKN